jgi:hypothetical protein
MTNFEPRHPEEGWLLRYIDGELPGRKSRQLERHLEACWQCRTALEELKKAVADCVKYRHAVQEHYPAPPEPWRDLGREFDRTDAERARPSFTWWLRWAVPAVAMAALAVVAWYQFRGVPSVEAAALLKRAVAASESRHNTAPHRIRIRTRNSQFTRTVGQNADASTAQLQALFQSAHYDWDDPLSARSYQSWRGTLLTKTDKVDPGPETYQVHTETTEGELVSASLTLRTADLSPIEGRLEFRNNEWVELTEISDVTTRTGGTTAENAVGRPERRAEPSLHAVAPPGSQASISDELTVLAALHEIGADLGDPVEVSRSGESVRVSGVGLAPERQLAIHKQLDGLPRVTIDFTNPEVSAGSAPAGSVEPPAGNPAPGKVQARMEQQLGGHAEFERFSGKMIERNEALMARAYALSALTQRFSAETEAGLSEPDRKVLRQMAREHLGILQVEAGVMQRALAPVLVAVGGNAVRARSAADRSSWQSAAEDLGRAAHRVDELLPVALGAAPAKGSSDGIPSELLAALADLQASVQQCKGLLTQE